MGLIWFNFGILLTVAVFNIYQEHTNMYRNGVMVGLEECKQIIEEQSNDNTE